jgi:hypothetical protein
MQDTIVVIVTAFVGAIVLLIGAATSQFDPREDEEEGGSSVDIATGGSGGHSSHQGMSDTLKAEFTSNSGDADIQIGVTGPLDPSHSKKRRQSQKVIQNNPKQCTHCGALNGGSGGPCWSCGSRPEATFSSEGIDAVNKHLRETPVDSSYLARGPTSEEQERPRSPGSLEDLEKAKAERDERRKQATTEDDVRRQKEIPFYYKWAGYTLAWVDKWKSIIDTHARSLMIVTSFATSIWGLSIIYGALTFNGTGLTALVMAVLIAIVSATIGALCFLAPGKLKTVVLGYPFALNVILLPPVVIAVYDPRLNVILEQSVLFAEYLLTNYATVLGLEMWLRSTFTLEGINYLFMWFSISFPLGWFLGGTVSVSKTTILYTVELAQNIAREARRTRTGTPQPPPEGEPPEIPDSK